jgi:putative ABC transport system permease protein
VDAPPGAVRAHRLESRVRAVSGVQAVSSLDHTYAYVGPDLQDTFGIDPATIARATSLRDSYFLGATASRLLRGLRARPDGILVSKETVTDYSLASGDLLKLRLLDRRSGRFRVVPFHVLGVVQEFPSAPRDSFMVANRSYVLLATHDPGPNVVFVKAAGDVVAVAKRVGAVVKPAGAVVRNLRQQSAQTVTSITSVDLSGISRIEEAFAVGLVVAAMLFYVALTLAERRREFATMAALSAGRRRIAGFVWSECALVLLGALALAALLGWLLAEMLVAMLQHVFDPPPDHLAAPWGFLVVLAGAAVASSVASGAVASFRIGRLPVSTILRDE